MKPQGDAHGDDDDGRLERRVAEVARFLRQAYEADKLGAVGRLAAGLAHEINNPLAFMRSNHVTLSGYIERLGRLRERLPEVPAGWHELELDYVIEDGRDLLAECLAGADRIARLVRDLKGFSHVDKPDEQMADINDCVRAAASLIENNGSATAKLSLDLGQLPRILCLPGHLNQVFFNVIENAVLASKGRGEVKVSSRAEEQAIVVTITDHGDGIAPEEVGKVFEPFYTTRPVGAGTGLGLTVARDIVRAHDGDITIDSRPGVGTTVVIRLPA